MTRRNWLCIFVLAVLAFAAFSSGGCGGSDSSDSGSPSTQSEDVTPAPQSEDVTPAPEAVVSGTFRISGGMYNDGRGTITGSTPSEFEFTLTKNADGETFTVALSETVQCTVSSGDTVPLDIEGSDYRLEPEDGKDYYVSGTGDHDGVHSAGEVWKEIGIDENGRPDFKREVCVNNGWVTVLEGQLEQVSLD